jgi:hypothetical protein
MEDYLINYEKYEKVIIYNFNLGDGGIADNIKFFILLLDLSLKNNYRLYYKINNIKIEKYIKLKYDFMYIYDNILNNLPKTKITNRYINLEEINNSKYKYFILKPQDLYNYKISNDRELIIKKFNIKLNDIFIFSNDIINNTKNIINNLNYDYISIHLRLGDKYLENNKSNIICKNDERKYNINDIDNLISNLISNKSNIILFTDNYNIKLKLKNKFNELIITNADIGHTSFENTSEKQVLDAITEFYIMTNSTKIIGLSKSGFSLIASKFKNIDIKYL